MANIAVLAFFLLSEGGSPLETPLKLGDVIFYPKKEEGYDMTNHAKNYTHCFISYFLTKLYPNNCCGPSLEMPLELKVTYGPGGLT